MAKYGSVSFGDLQKWKRELQKIERETDAFLASCAKELAAMLLQLVIPLTPKGKYDKFVRFTTKDGREVAFQPHTGKKGGTLRRGWTVHTHEEAESDPREPTQADISAYLNGVAVERKGGVITVTVVNPVEYAPYVEFGHRSAVGHKFVAGQHMLKLSEDELQTIMPQILERRMKRFLEGAVS